jgi:HEAT repeat protein
MRLLAKAARAHQLYLPNNPMYRRAVDALRDGFTAVWRDMPELTLAVGESDFRLDGSVVWDDASSAKSPDSLPWLFYKDGVREITIREGFQAEEVPKLLEVIQRARRAMPDDDDLVTLLWEADFSLLSYKNVDLLLEGTGDDVVDGTEVGQVPPSEIANGVRETVEEEKPAGLVSVADLDTTLYFLDPPEIAYLQRELEREYTLELRTSITTILLDIFEGESSAAARGEVLEHLQSLLVFALTAGDFRAVAYMLREARASAERCRDLAPEQRTGILSLGARLSTPDAFTQLLHALDESPTPPSPAELADLFEQLDPSVLANVFHWIGRMASPAIRAALQTAADRLAAANTSELVRLIGNPDAGISAEAVRRCGALKAQAAVLGLSKLLAEQDPQRRLLAAQALAEIGSPGALQALERGVLDSERDVRISAVRALAARGHRAALPKVESIVKGKAIRDMDLTEKMAFFESYGALSGDDGVAHCDGILNGKGLLGRREDPELRACAAVALGRIGTPKALDALRKAAAEKDVVVRNAVGRALRGGAAAT